MSAPARTLSGFQRIPVPPDETVSTAQPDLHIQPLFPAQLPQPISGPGHCTNPSGPV